MAIHKRREESGRAVARVLLESAEAVELPPAEVDEAATRTTDRASRMHLDDVRDQIARILDPKFAPPAASNAPNVFSIFRFEEDESCWPDYTFRLPR
jgi:hypothetical protein